MLDRWIEAVQRWGVKHPDVVGILLVGSHARGEATPNSDIDIVVLVDEVQPYLADHAWANAFGGVEREASENWGQVQSLRVWYADGAEIEWGLTTRSWVGDPLDPGTRHVLEDGYRLVFDRGGFLASRLASFGIQAA